MSASTCDLAVTVVCKLTHLGLLFRSLQCGQQPLVGTPLEGRVVLKIVVAQPLRGPSRGTTNPASA